MVLDITLADGSKIGENTIYCILVWISKRVRQVILYCVVDSLYCLIVVNILWIVYINSTIERTKYYLDFGVNRDIVIVRRRSGGSILPMVQIY